MQQFEICFSEKRLLSCDLFWRRGEEPEPLLCCSQLCCQWHKVPRTKRTRMPMKSRELAETKLSCTSFPVKAASPPWQPGRETIQVHCNYIKHLLLAPGTYCRDSDCVVLQSAASFRLQVPCDGHHALFWVRAAEGHSPAQTRNSKSKCSRHSGNGTLCFALGQCCWRTQPGSNKKYGTQPAWSSSCCQQPSLWR